MELGEYEGAVVVLAAEHHAVGPTQRLPHRAHIFEAAVHNELQLRERKPEAFHYVVAQRWDLAVVLRRESPEDGLAGVNDCHLAPGVADPTHEIVQGFEVGFVELRNGLVGRPALRGYDSNTHFYRDRDANNCAHRSYAVRNSRGLQHQARAESAARDPVAGAAAVEVDFVVAGFLADAGGFCEVFRFA